MKTGYFCDRCGLPLRESVPDYYKIEKDGDEDRYVGIAAVYRDDDEGAKYDLCKQCTIEIAKEFIRLAENDG